MITNLVKIASENIQAYMYCVPCIFFHPEFFDILVASCSCDDLHIDVAVRFNGCFLSTCATAQLLVQSCCLAAVLCKQAVASMGTANAQMSQCHCARTTEDCQKLNDEWSNLVAQGWFGGCQE